LTVCSISRFFEETPEVQQSTWFTDEALLFWMSVISSRLCVYGPKKTNIKQWRQCYMVWCTVSVHCIIGPIFLTDTVNADFYPPSLQRIIPPAPSTYGCQGNSFFKRIGLTACINRSVECCQSAFSWPSSV
jgi:hypothetical protein